LAGRERSCPLLLRQQRKQFGKAISEFQAIQFKLAGYGHGVERRGGSFYRAAWLADQ